MRTVTRTRPFLSTFARHIVTPRSGDTVVVPRQASDQLLMGRDTLSSQWILRQDRDTQNGIACFGQNHSSVSNWIIGRRRNAAKIIL